MGRHAVGRRAQLIGAWDSRGHVDSAGADQVGADQSDAGRRRCVVWTGSLEYDWVVLLIDDM